MNQHFVHVCSYVSVCVMCCQATELWTYFPCVYFYTEGGVWGDLLASDPTDISGPCSTLCLAPICVLGNEAALCCSARPLRQLPVSVACVNVCMIICVCVLDQAFNFTAQILVQICNPANAEPKHFCLKSHIMMFSSLLCNVYKCSWWGHKYAVMDSLWQETSLLYFKNAIAVAEFNKCSSLEVLCDKWHKSEKLVKWGAQT